MYFFHMLCVLMFVTSVLTLVTNKETQKIYRDLEIANNSTLTILNKFIKDSENKGSIKKNLSTEEIGKNSSVSRI